MKTTLNLDDGLLRQAKKTAAERGVTLTSVLEDALRDHLTTSRPARRKERFRWVIVKDTELPPVDISSRRDLYDFLEAHP